jgi:hypothetical protein
MSISLFELLALVTIDGGCHRAANHDDELGAAQRRKHQPRLESVFSHHSFIWRQTIAAA